MRPVIFDGYCGAGGAAVGYYRAGFDVIGVYSEPQPNYPFEFHQADARDFLAANWRDFDAAHTSPPCQASCALTKGTNKGREYINHIPETRRLLQATGLPTVIENVPGSNLRRDLVLCGEMFGLEVIRHRYFEVDGFDAQAPAHKPHRGRVRGWRHGVYFDGPYVAVYGSGGGKGSVADWQGAMGIDWTDVRLEIAEAIPPAYTEHIGRQLIRQIRGNEAAA